MTTIDDNNAMRGVTAPAGANQPPQPPSGQAAAALIAVNLLLTAAMGALLGSAVGIGLAPGTAVGLVAGVLIVMGQRLIVRRRTAKPALANPSFLASGDRIALLVALLLIMLVAAVLWFGIWVAYGFAVLATPIWLLALMLLAMDGANPDAATALPDDLELPE